MTSESQGDNADGNRINFATLICALIAAGASIFGATASLYGTYSTNKSNTDTAALARNSNFFQTVIIPYNKDLQKCVEDVRFAFDEVCDGTVQLPSERLTIQLSHLDALGRTTPPGWNDVEESIKAYCTFVGDSLVDLGQSKPAQTRQHYQETANGHRLALLDAMRKCYQETQPRRTDVK
jgi:hypothetical protein